MQNELKWIAHGRKLVGTKEIKGLKHNPVILSLWRSAFEATSQPLTSAFKNDETAWCGGFVGGVLAETGLSHHIPKSFPMARSWLKAGTKLNNPTYGCIVVFWRGNPKGASGHVGFVVGRDKTGNLMVLGGNQSDEINIKPFSTTRVLGYRWCGTQSLPNTSRFALPVLASDGRVSKNEA
ncbi:TIGR02594 family protein [Moraxella bovis]|uniref:TIGR02594 family protein n=1 Tax=Moraxella bovis TaxID=476 RepID=UPI0022266625|nr:TIGR02594 family protein [Moraxella bovis]UYZ80387.1 TIGR02594 family protein [Moraxella bovis]UZA05450.1 TIGR02594 family protein [Moraxella bovis]UZA12320.1 TIGR02594 family protein [Moraxella bovis]